MGRDSGRVSVWFAPVRRAGLALALAAAIVATAPACGGEEERTFRNPVFAENFRDPFVLRVDDTYYAYGTKDAEGIRSGEDRQVVPGNVQMLQSDDLVTWKRTSDALPEVGKSVPFVSPAMQRLPPLSMTMVWAISAPSVPSSVE